MHKTTHPLGIAVEPRERSQRSAQPLEGKIPIEAEVGR